MSNQQTADSFVSIRETIARRDRLARDLERVERLINEQTHSLQDLESQRKREAGDVRRLEGLSFMGIFYSIMGTKDSKLDDERREMLAAELKYQACQSRIDTLQRDAESLRIELTRIGNLENRYERLLDEKERILRAGGGPEGSEMAQIAEAMSAALNEERELREAISAGEHARAGLSRAVESLSSAKNWGMWDLFGGGMISSAVKHSKLEDAYASVQETQPLLQRFERELADVGESVGITIDTGGLTAFADIFIDGLLIDLFVQSRINESLDAAIGMENRVADLLARLARSHEEAENRLRAAQAARKAKLENE